MRGYDQPVVVVRSEGYASSLAAASLCRPGLRRAGDLDGGYWAWRAWQEGRPSASYATGQRGIPGRPAVIPMDREA